MALSSILEHFVVNNVSDSHQVGQILKSRQLFKSIIILENAPKMDKSSLAERRKKLSTNQYLAFDLLDFQVDNNFIHNYLVHYLKDTVICGSYEDAVRLKREHSFNKIITLKGDLLKDSGVESYGSQYHLPLKIKRFINK